MVNTPPLSMNPRIGHSLLLFCLLASSVSARINVVALPGRDTVQLTIYNSTDLTLVKETRALTFRKGLNRLEFSWANTLIDPTSVEFRALTHADDIDVLDASFPPGVANTLEWRIKSEFAGEAQVEIRYFTSGISWSADYVAESEKNEKLMTLAGSVRVNNNSGEDYENAQVRLVVGVVRLVEEIAALAQQSMSRGKDKDSYRDLGRLGGVAGRREKRASGTVAAFGGAFALMDAKTAERPREVIKEEMGEYFLYTVEGRDTIPTTWSKRLPSSKAPGVPITSYYKYEQEKWSEQVMRYYRFTNSEPSKLGQEPLPDGSVKAFRLVSDDKLYAFVGSAQVKYIPINETVEMELGQDQEVLVKPALMNWEKSEVRFDQWGNVAGWTIKESWTCEVQNSKDIDIMLDIRRTFSGDWSLVTEAKYEKVNANKVKFILPLKPHEKQTFRYDLTVHHGVNVTK